MVKMNNLLVLLLTNSSGTQPLNSMSIGLSVLEVFFPQQIYSIYLPTLINIASVNVSLDSNEVIKLVLRIAPPLSQK